MKVMLNSLVKLITINSLLKIAAFSEE